MKVKSFGSSEFILPYGRGMAGRLALRLSEFILPPGRVSLSSLADVVSLSPRSPVLRGGCSAELVVTKRSCQTTPFLRYIFPMCVRDALSHTVEECD